jgi:hypothetical protein
MLAQGQHGEKPRLRVTTANSTIVGVAMIIATADSGEVAPLVIPLAEDWGRYAVNRILSGCTDCPQRPIARIGA